MSQVGFAAFFLPLFVQTFSEHINGPNCGKAVPFSRIVNGKTVSRDKMPWIVFVRTSFQEDSEAYTNQFCSGSIVSHSFIVTAAHCLTTKKETVATDVVVYYNSSQIEDGPQVNVKRYARHPDFILRLYANDIAILQLEKPLKFDKFVSPVCLPRKPLNIAGKRLLIAGWGLTTEGGLDSQQLRYITKGELPFNQCKPLLHTEAQLLLNETIVICTSARNKDACAGDSGGPVTMWDEHGKSVLVGIVSFGYGCARADEASGYTRVATFVPWVLSTMKRFEESSKEKN
ncbi:hypothetical protein MTO96_005962 [Rhipicephalus appendiculatus]